MFSMINDGYNSYLAQMYSLEINALIFLNINSTILLELIIFHHYHYQHLHHTYNLTLYRTVEAFFWE